MWHYGSENFAGNLHATAAQLTERHADWDVIAMQSNGGNYTVVVYRRTMTDDEIAAFRARREAEAVHQLELAERRKRGGFGFPGMPPITDDNGPESA